MLADAPPSLSKQFSVVALSRERERVPELREARARAGEGDQPIFGRLLLPRGAHESDDPLYVRFVQDSFV